LPEVTGQQVEKRRLARAIRADHRVQLAAVQFERDVARGHQSAEVPGQALRAQQRVTHRRDRQSVQGLKRSARLARPPGRKITSTMIVPPSSKLPMGRHRLVDFLQGDEHERAGNGAVQAAHAAQDQHEQHVAPTDATTATRG
jgi:hypothetical protein